MGNCQPETAAFLFALVLGPLNLWYLHRRGKRIWLVWTIPALSLSATLMVGFYAILLIAVTAVLAPMLAQGDCLSLR